MADQHRVWTAIAESFSRTRQRPWAHVESFLHRLPPRARVLDLMAGNGRHGRLAASLGLDVVSLDWSRPLVRQAPNGVTGDAVTLPLADATFDAAVYAAGLHGLPTAQARRASLRELLRVLRPGGLAQVTVWSRDAPRFSTLDLPPGPADVTVPWRADGHDEARFYHLFTSTSLRDALLQAGFEVDAVDTVQLAADAPDNLVGTVRRP